MLYIVRRTQLYPDDSLWSALHVYARAHNTTISELVREAVRERYFTKQDERRKAMLEFVGSCSDGAETDIDTDEYIRSLRRSSRLDRLHAE